MTTKASFHITADVTIGFINKETAELFERDFHLQVDWDFPKIDQRYQFSVGMMETYDLEMWKYAGFGNYDPKTEMPYCVEKVDIISVVANKR